MTNVSKRSLDWSRWERWGLVALGVATVFAIAGFATFALRPEMLARFPNAADFYPKAFPFFAQGHIAVAFLVLGGALVLRAGVQWVPALVATFVVSLSAELAGTSMGWLFGPYEYTSLLGPKIMGLVPWLIPVSWFFMAAPAYGLTTRLELPMPVRWLLGACLLTIWDLTLDPAMSELSPYWRWETPGPFYGMPLQNIAGWMATGLALMAAMELLRAHRWTDNVPRTFWWAFYFSVLALSCGMVLAAGFWGALLATAGGLAVVVGAMRAPSFFGRSPARPVAQEA